MSISRFLVAVAFVLCAAPGARLAAQAGPTDTDAHAFDFSIGAWKIHNRRLAKLLSGSTEWYEFDAHSVIRPVGGGLGSLEDWDGTGPKGRIQGVNLRVYNPTSHEWSVLWVSKLGGTIDKPVIGRFHDGRGEFFDQETLAGRSIFVRYLWTNITTSSAHWEQAFSVDGGQTWETNWIMDMSREPQGAH